MRIQGPKQVTLRFRHHQLGIDIDAQVNGQWHLVELVRASNFDSIEAQWAFPKGYVAALRAKGYVIAECA